METKKLRVGAMTCINCQNKIQKKLQSTNGVEEAEVSYKSGTAKISYDTAILTVEQIVSIIEGLGYEVLTDGKERFKIKRVAGILIIILALYLFASHISTLAVFSSFPTVEEGMGYGMLFLIGLLTSVHCVAMCGGINLSQCISKSVSINSGTEVIRPSFLYNFGRVISYTVIGGIVGMLGSVISLSGAFKGAIQIIAGIFMVIMGLNMLDLLPPLRRIGIRLPNFITKKVELNKSRSNSPLYIGILNGLMPCGPLQAMQLFALSTGSVTKGALSMFFFSLGTVPLMFGFGTFSSLLGKNFTKKVMAIGGVLVAVLGLTMFSQGWLLSGFQDLVPRSHTTATTATVSYAEIKDGVQEVRSKLASGGYPEITVTAGVPVKWIIDAPEGSINGCNNRMIIPEYDIEYSFAVGENIIEFTPTKTGVFSYSCWMGMIKGSIDVIEA